MSDRRFVARSSLPVPVADLAAWHERPAALSRLLPPWQDVRVVERTGSELRDGLVVALSLPAGPFRMRWEALHRDVEPGRGFTDVQRRGPFASFVHRHRFEPGDGSGSRLVDDMTYRLPFGPLGALGAGFARRDLTRTFAYRHAVTRSDLVRHAGAAGAPLRVAISGAGGLVGGALAAFLACGGHRVVRLVRRPSRGEDEIAYDPDGDGIEAEKLAGVDAVVHLAGESIMGRWTADKKRRIRDSRVRSTRLIARALAAAEPRPGVLVNASAIGYYGDRGDAALDEDAGPGSGFLADTAVEWENATAAAADAGARVVRLRIGVVVSAAGGTVGALAPLFSLGLGGPVGPGRQVMSWIALDDLVGLIHAALTDPRYEGAVNATAPEPVRNRAFGATLGRVLGRPAVLPVPETGVRVAFGEMGEELLLASTRVVPARATSLGFRFEYPVLEDALRHTLGRREGLPEGMEVDCR